MNHIRSFIVKGWSAALLLTVFVGSASSQSYIKLEPIIRPNRSFLPANNQSLKKQTLQTDALSIAGGRQGIILSAPRDSISSNVYFIEKKDPVRVIVQFRSLPLSRVVKLVKDYRANMAQSALASIRDEHARFHSDLAMLEGRLKKGRTPRSTFNQTQVHAEYQTAFNGVAITTTQEVASALQKMPYVSKIWEDDTVHAVDDVSNGVIGAPAFWDSTGLHGEGIDIGFIDSGIDYLHEALGGAPFPNAKVVGGYNFVNNTADPMDDAGHGTHCAGIAAGYGPPPTNLRGVAYNARLWAFKVLDATGSGYTSWVMSGIEASLDPDNNPATPTPIKVISLSLGGGIGDPNEPMCQAIDNATASGMICVIAAGNSGPGGWSISSPGAARTAITVGASTDADSIASFSSCGPTYYHWLIKPDITAPGVSILSSYVGGGYTNLSGTSMATPHVAGAAALMCELHPDWPPEEIKAALVQSAHTLGNGVYTEGGGRLSLGDAASRTVDITPTTLIFGIDDNASSTWGAVRTIEIHNNGPASVSYSLTDLPPLTHGTTLAFDQSTVTIPSHSAVSVNVTLNVDNAAVPFRVYGGYGYPNYTGTINATCATGPPIRIPYAFTKTTMLRLACEETPWFFMQLVPPNATISYEVGLFLSPGFNDTIDLLWPNGIYTIFGSFADYHTKIVKENVVVNGVTVLPIRKEDSKNSIILRHLDQTGQPYSFSGASLGWDESLIDSTGWDVSTDEVFNGFGIDYQPDLTIDTSYFPDVSPHWRFNTIIQSIKNGEYREFIYSPPFGITSPMILQNDPAQLKEVDYTYAPVPGDDAVYISGQIWTQTGIFPRFTMMNPTPISAPYQLKAFYSPPPPLDTSTTFNQYAIRSIYPFWWSTPLYFISACTLSQSTGQLTFLHGNNDDYPPTLGNISPTTYPYSVKVGYGAPCWTGITTNSPGNVKIQNISLGGPLWSLGARSNEHWSSSDNKQEVEYIQTGYNIAGYNVVGTYGAATALLDFDLSRPDPDPPSLSGLWVTSGGLPADEIYLGEDNKVIFQPVDASSLDTLRIFFRPLDWLYNPPNWTEYYRTKVGNYWTAALPQEFDGYVSMRLRMVDHYGNSLDYQVEPAFLYHRYGPSVPTVEYPPDSVVDLPYQPTLSWQRSIGTSSYHLEVALDDAFNRLVFNQNLTGTSLTIGPLRRLTKYYWRLSGINPAGESQFSAPRSFVTADTMNRVIAGDGWNLISVSLNLRTQMISSIFPSALSPAYAYGGSSYIAYDSLRPGNGFWLRFTKVDTFLLAGYSILAETLAVSPGWNLIGSITRPAILSSIESDPPGMITSQAFGYHGGYVPTDTLLPGNGYWIKVESAGSLILGSPGAGTATAIRGRVRVVPTDELPPPPPIGKAQPNIAIPKVYALDQNYPNPFNPATTLKYALPFDSRVTLIVYNILGQEIAVLIKGVETAGYKSVEWNASDYPSGIYFYRLEATSTNDLGKTFSDARKMLLVK